MTPVVQRAALVLVALLAAELALLLVLSSALAIPLARFETGLLLGATTVLGTVWGLRDHLSRRAPGASLAAYVPPMATALFLSPRLARGVPADALLTVAVSVLASVALERAWSGFVTAELRPPGHVFGARVAAPCLATSLLALAIDRSPDVALAAGGSTCCAVLAGAWIAYRAARTEREALALARRIGDVDVRGGLVRIPRAAPPTDPWLRALEQRLRERARELAEEAAEARRAEAEIDEVRRLRSRFMASMSHDLKSPLNSIVGFAQVLESGVDGELNEAQRQSVSTIRRSSEELIRLLTDTLDLARIEAGRLTLDRRWIPSVEILTEAVRRGRALVAGRDVEIEAELQPGLPPVYVDAPRIVQAVVALFRHAAASMERTTVRLRARAALGPPGPERQLRVEFYDAIGALPTAEVARIFEAFEEISAPAGRRLGGLGMALSLSRSLVRLHGGDVWADVAPGAGTVLCVALPLDDAEARP